MGDKPRGLYPRGKNMGTPEPTALSAGLIVVAAMAVLLGLSVVFKGRVVFG